MQSNQPIPLQPLEMDAPLSLDRSWLLRLPLALLFGFSAVTKVIDLDAGYAEMAQFGLPEASVFPLIALQLVGAAALLSGFALRLAAFALAVFVLTASTLAHNPFASGQFDVRQATTFLEHIVIIAALGFLSIRRKS